MESQLKTMIGSVEESGEVRESPGGQRTKGLKRESHLETRDTMGGGWRGKVSWRPEDQWEKAGEGKSAETRRPVGGGWRG